MKNLDKVKEILVSVSGCDADNITADTSLVKDMDMDSFAIMDAVTALERAFDISIPDRDLRKLSTVGDVTAYLESQGK